jgi:hypothetical protein
MANIRLCVMPQDYEAGSGITNCVIAYSMQAKTLRAGHGNKS